MICQGKKREKTGGRASVASGKSEKRCLGFAFGCESLLYRCMSMGIGLFPRPLLKCGKWFPVSSLRKINKHKKLPLFGGCRYFYTYLFSQRALSGVMLCGPRQRQDTGCLSWLVSEVSNASISLHTHVCAHTLLIQATYTQSLKQCRTCASIFLASKTLALLGCLQIP